MDTIKDIFKDLKDRISSPFFSSFIISWLIINWRVTIGIVLYKSETISKYGYNSFFELIEKNDDMNLFLWYPLISALLYTFIIPAFKNVVGASNAFMNRWGQNWSLKISKPGTVSVIKYIELRDKYKKIIDEYTEALKADTVFLTEKADLKKEIAEAHQQAAVDKADLEHRIELLHKTVQESEDKRATFQTVTNEKYDNLKKEYNKLLAANDSSMINGRWQKNIAGQLHIFQIEDAKIYSIILNIDQVLDENIIFFYRKVQTGFIIMITTKVKPGTDTIDGHNTYYLRSNDELTEMSGDILNKGNVGFIKISSDHN